MLAVLLTDRAPAPMALTSRVLARVSAGSAMHGGGPGSSEEGPAMVRAYVLIETAAGKTGFVRDSVGHGLMNTLAVGHSFRPAEVMVHLEATALEDLHRAIMVDIPTLDGVKRVIPCMIVTSE
jgi:hypothetical protein